jgi:hypothetical protein
MVLTTWVTLYGCGGASAALPHPGTWSSQSADGKFTFVMLSPLPIEEDFRRPEFEAEVRAIRSKYSKSGLYVNGSATPLWTYDGPWLEEPAIVAPDGEHVIFPGSWTADEYYSDAVLFMRRGQVLHSYRDDEIIPQWVLKAVLNRVINPTGPSCVGTSFDAEQMTYSIYTNQREEIVFDVKTGEIIQTRSPFPVFFGLAITVLTIPFAIVVARWRRSKQRVNP